MDMNPIASFAPQISITPYDHLDEAGLHDIHAGTRITLIEDNASGAERHRCADPLREHSHVDFIAIHVRLAFPSHTPLDSGFMPKTRGRGLALPRVERDYP
jgi:hypothetical protein